MDFLDPKKKQAHRSRLLIGYALMIIILAIGTRFLFLQVYGYGYDSKTGEVIQKGILFVDAHPEAATIFLNGEDKGRTDGRFVLPAGDYNLELKRDGYRTWKHDLRLETLSIERLVYPFMFPEKFKTKDIQLYSKSPVLATASPDRHWLVVQQAGNLTTLDVTDLSTSEGTTTAATLPDRLLEPAGANHQLEMIEWSTDNRRVLLKHTHDKGTEFIIFDRQVPAESVNLNRLFSRPFTQVALRDKKFDQLYLYNQADATLVSTSLKTRVISPVADHVLSFKSHGNDIVLFAASEPDNTKDVAIKIWMDGGKVYTLRKLPANTTYLLDLARFDGRWYIAAGAATEQRLYIYQNPFDKLQATPSVVPQPLRVLRLAKPLQFLQFSANTRFISIQSGAEIALYDAENDRQYRYDIGLPLADKQKAAWMDGHRLAIVTSESKLVVFDFDGTNTQVLNTQEIAFQPFFDRDYEAMFQVGPSVTVPGRPAITRTEIKLLPD